MIEKKCSLCSVVKPITDFHKRSGRKSGIVSACKICSLERQRINRNTIYKTRIQNYLIENKEKRKVSTKAWKSRNEERVKRIKAIGRYKLPEPEYIKLIKDSNNKCSICNKSEYDNGKKLSIDHDHKTGKVRGILCNSCNTGLGFFKDNPEFLIKASLYIKSHESKKESCFQLVDW